MTIEEILELAKAGTGARTPLQRAIIELLETPSPAFPAITADRRMGSVWIPREANRSYRPEHARQLAMALMRAADVADEGRRPADPDDGPVYESAAHARLAQEQARLDREQREQTGAIVVKTEEPTGEAAGPAPEAAEAKDPPPTPVADKAPAKRDGRGGGRGRHG